MIELEEYEFDYTYDFNVENEKLVIFNSFNNFVIASAL